LGTKNIFVQFFTGNTRATHYATSTDYQPFACLSGWDNKNFLSGRFWDQNPTPDNIICALYGSGDGSATAYTQFWS
jgi:hypothetical protein